MRDLDRSRHSSRDDVRERPALLKVVVFDGRAADFFALVERVTIDQTRR